ncbi:TetR family transcriptional regulator [Variovorax boronicumulans]|nr:TetR family transcriptional regulator [Variovorax boronicumulans]
MSIAAVAAEAGVTPALIHNTYPDIAEAIRTEAGRSTRRQLDAKAAELAKVGASLRELRRQLHEANADIAKLASINESLRQEAALLRDGAKGHAAIFSSLKKI